MLLRDSIVSRSFIKALEAVKLAPKHQGGKWLQQKYEQSLKQGGSLSPSEFPINTHGGLMCFAAPWETPAMYNIIEATAQLTGKAADRQVPNAKTALVYGNGGVFSSSSVAILSNE